MAKKYLSVIVILFYSTAFANVYETDNNGVPTFSNVDTKGAKQVSVDKPQVVNSYNQISNGPSLNDYKQKEIIKLFGRIKALEVKKDLAKILGI